MRVLATVGRYPETPRRLRLRLVGDGFELVEGEQPSGGRPDRDARVWAALTETPQTVEELAERTGLSDKIPWRPSSDFFTRVSRPGRYWARAGGAEGSQARPRRCPLAGPPHRWNHADVGGERRAAAEPGEVAEGRHEPGRGLRPNALDGRQAPTDLMVIEQAVDITLGIAQTAPQEVEVLAGAADLNLIDLAMVTAHGARGRREQGGGEFVTDPVAAVPEPGQAAERDPWKAAAVG